MEFASFSLPSRVFPPIVAFASPGQIPPKRRSRDAIFFGLLRTIFRSFCGSLKKLFKSLFMMAPKERERSSAFSLFLPDLIRRGFPILPLTQKEEMMCQQAVRFLSPVSFR